MHTLDDVVFNAVKRDKKLITGNINFSPKGIGAVRRGGKAIRVKPGNEGKIHFIKGNAEGWGVKYFKNGIKYLDDGKTVDLSQGQNYIPTDLLRYFDRELGRWVDFK